MTGHYCLQLDVGNSSAKWRLVNNAEVLARGVYVPDDTSSLEAMLGCAEQVQQVWIASVAGDQREGELATVLEQRWGVSPWFARTQANTGDLVNSYSDPGRMGVDRWLAMLGARHRYRERLCVVDAGSAVTIDLVAEDGRHEGGYIIPGPTLMERALLLDTDRVRFAEAVEYDLPPGRSTAEAVRHGVALAEAGAVNLAMEQAGEPAPRLVLCGGAAPTMQQLLNGRGEWLPDLVFEGLQIMAGQ
ncbi:type III pantothenate kinase [Kineobactrum sediminis]|uniref:Type III pantothenate kinase n=1 Tax=Kineobactrum sediminis TaxID=1905677 RepID=A0A2N5XY36_9GAMM|nr:type III pantothenate kinase [Kineobactrum sediminis]PLW81019.1 type III pantothenate kinase [Kineobactrum sediminis]